MKELLIYIGLLLVGGIVGVTILLGLNYVGTFDGLSVIAHGLIGTGLGVTLVIAVGALTIRYLEL